MKKTCSRLPALILTLALLFSLTACGGSGQNSTGEAAGGKIYKIGLCNYVDDASLNQICDNIRSRLAEIGEANSVTFEIHYENCNADSGVLSQIIANFQADRMDLMIGVATPVAMAMQNALDGTDIPIVYSAVSDPVAVGLAKSMTESAGNITGTSDALNTNAIFDLMLLENPGIKKVGLLYDVGQDSSTSAIASAKEYLTAKGISFTEYTGTNVTEVALAAEAAVADGMEAVFTPTDNTIMTAELTIYETFAKAGVLHYAGANSFALNGAFLGYGVDYIELGKATADIVKEILIDGKKPAEIPPMTFDNGTATVNTDICEALGLDYDGIAALFAPGCTKVEAIKTAESFE